MHLWQRMLLVMCADLATHAGDSGAFTCITLGSVRLLSMSLYDLANAALNKFSLASRQSHLSYGNSQLSTTSSEQSIMANDNETKDGAATQHLKEAVPLLEGIEE